MATITVMYNIKSEPFKEKIKRELRWYDNIKQEMQIFKGGKLGFEYKEDKFLVAMGEQERKRRGITSIYRMLPKVEEFEFINYGKMKTTTNENKIRKWFDDYLNYNISNVVVISSDRDSIDFDVPEKEEDDFLYDCERNGFRTRG